MNQGAWLMISAVMMALSVALGAFGAHGLKPLVSAELLATWQTAVQYHLIHALALLALSLFSVFARSSLNFTAILWGVLLGMIFFSGSLYLWVLSQWHPLVFITPVGGTIWVLTWLTLAWKAREIA